MSLPILTTKLYIPPPRPRIVHRPHLIGRLTEGLHHKLTLISAPAGFGKTTLVSEWLAQSDRPAAWLSLDEGDSDPTRFLTCLIAALQTIAPNIGKGVLSVLQATPPPSTESILSTLLNEITTLPGEPSTPLRTGFILVLDDYHLIDAKAIDDALAFVLEHQPAQMHLVIATREDPQLPLAQLRVRDQLTEVRAADLRFTSAQAADFLNQVMGLTLSAEDIAALETRTEGWIAGLQLAAISMQGLDDTTHFIQSFTGSHRFVMDYLVEQVLGQQSEIVQQFLLRTSILDRMCGPLCDAVLGKDESEKMKDEKEMHSEPSYFILHPSSLVIEYLEHANLFIVPLDNERRWYRYHHLFADLLRKRLGFNLIPERVAELHIRASEWFENNGLMLEAFRHATTANDVERAERLIEGKGMPLHFRGAVTPVLRWLNSLPATALDAYPSLWTTYASVLLVSGQQTAAEQKLQAAEKALQDAEPNDRTRDLIGRIAAIRATVAVNQYQVETVITQSRRALEFLRPDNLAFRTFTIWKLGYAYHIQGDRAAASRAYTEAISISQASGNMITTIVATIGLGTIQETENQFSLATQTYQRVLQLFGDHPLPFAGAAQLGLARISYEWNDLSAAQQYAEQSIQLARQGENPDQLVSCEVFLARLRLAQGDLDGATDLLAQASQLARQNNFAHRMSEVAATQILVLLRQGNLATAAQLAQTHPLALSQARVHLAQHDPSAALAVLIPFRQQMEAKGWADERLRAMVLQAIALHAHGERDEAAQLLGDALALAEPGGLIRTFVDEGEPMRLMISNFRFSILKTAPHLSAYLEKLLAAFQSPQTKSETLAPHPIGSAGVRNQKSKILIEPLSERELQVLRLIAQGLSNREISERLFLALSTVKGHSRIIFDKLQVHNRTEAAARARELGLL